MVEVKDMQPARAPVEQDVEAGSATVEKSTGVEEAAKSQSQDIPLENLTASGESAPDQEPEDTRKYMSGWKLHMLTIG